MFLVDAYLPPATVLHHSEEAADHWFEHPLPARHRTTSPRPAAVHPHRQAAPVRPASLPKAWAAGQWSRFPARVERLAMCVAGHESASAGLWLARNPSSSASGAFQFVDGTWQANARRAGFTGPSRAYLAPPAVQAAVFAWVVEHGGMGAWRGTNCPGT